METTITETLNSAQREAVTAEPGNLLILAGAGSGKTRVLVHRIAWLIENQQVSPYAILAVTFTNKAANEMRGRIEQMVGSVAAGMWVGTFHGLAHRLLRLHWQAANLPETFQILDSEDQGRLVRRIIKNLDIDEERYPAKKAQWFINQRKDEGLRAGQVKTTAGDRTERTFLGIYEAYEEMCQRGGLVDFAELLLRTLELLQNNQEILGHYQQRFQHILVDEFQDTNAIQYKWLKLLAGGNTHMMIVGDDDQSIYSWRGAKVENIRRFQREFNDTRTILLEQNYRSTPNILKAANVLIGNNSDRLGKNLWTEGEAGEPILIYTAFNETDEARFIVDRAQYWHDKGHHYCDMAALYRSNAQSRVIEEALLQAGIPYRVYGGLRFFERAEIKDALAYLRLLINPHDDAAFERVVNFPTRGIGERTLQQLRDNARRDNRSLWQSASTTIEAGQLPPRATQSLTGFIELIERLAEESKEMELDELTEYMLEQSGLLLHYRQIKGEKGLAKVENLQELITATRQFENDEDDSSELTEFLSHAALEAGESQSSNSNDYLQLMTLHSAKGLEFPIIFLAGVEEGLFPHQMSAHDPRGLEEERRLCYVGITRAMRQLYISYAESRRLYGRVTYHTPSRFIRELPSDCLEEIRLASKVVRPTSYRSQTPRHSSTTQTSAQHESGLRVGQRVQHRKFGEGMITAFEGQGSRARIQVQFSQWGSKWLVFSYANLEPI
ncbi:MAG: DNA helicase II [Gammaproteobacteria bacterium]|nr:DNA helicase II [Gammaproteobacteria bacterium]